MPYNNKYEIDHINFGDGFHFQSEIAMLTGLGLDEVLSATSKESRWSGQAFVRLFQSLGYSCNNRWIKFDRNTKYPCMIRCKKPKVKSHWYGWVYYDGFIYDVYEGKITWAQWNAMWPNFKVTSMLQVWI